MKTILDGNLKYTYITTPVEKRIVKKKKKTNTESRWIALLL